MAGAIGIDLGGTTLRAALFGDRLLASAGGASTEPLQPIAEVVERVGGARAPEQIADRIAEQVEILGAPGSPAAGAPVGLGVAAMLAGDGVVASSPHLGWRDLDLGALLRARLGGRRFVVVNDVDAIAWGELAFGAGRGCRDLLVVCVGTGVGGGIVAGGRLIGGPGRCAAEIGHVRVVRGDDARPCRCGGRGCLEAYAGGSYLMTRGGGRHAGELDAAAVAGDAGALAILDEAARHLGGALAAAVTLLAPERLLLGGTVWRHCPTLRARTLAALDAAANPPARARLTVGELALEDALGPLGAGPLGAALLAAELAG